MFMQTPGCQVVTILAISTIRMSLLSLITMLISQYYKLASCDVGDLLYSLCNLNSSPAFLYPGRKIVKIHSELVYKRIMSDIIAFGCDIAVEMGQVMA